MYFITTKRMLEVCFSAHPNIQYRTKLKKSAENKNSAGFFTLKAVDRARGVQVIVIGNLRRAERLIIPSHHPVRWPSRRRLPLLNSSKCLRRQFHHIFRDSPLLPFNNLIYHNIGPVLFQQGGVKRLPVVVIRIPEVFTQCL